MRHPSYEYMVREKINLVSEKLYVVDDSSGNLHFVYVCVFVCVSDHKNYYKPFNFHHIGGRGPRCPPET